MSVSQGPPDTPPRPITSPQMGPSPVTRPTAVPTAAPPVTRSSGRQTSMPVRFKDYVMK